MRKFQFYLTLFAVYQQDSLSQRKLFCTAPTIRVSGQWLERWRTTPISCEHLLIFMILVATESGWIGLDFWPTTCWMNFLEKTVILLLLVIGLHLTSGSLASFKTGNSPRRTPLHLKRCGDCPSGSGTSVLPANWIRPLIIFAKNSARSV